MKDKFEKILKDFRKAVGKIDKEDALEDVRVQFLGRSSDFAGLMKGLKDLSPEDKKEAGQQANKVKTEMQGLLTKAEKGLSRQSLKGLSKDEWVDITEPVCPKQESGNRHPVTVITEQLEELFASMGFMILDGPELESDFYNFEGLNIPKTHPARDMQDTFYVKGHEDWSMRPHTSPVQVRAMQKYGAPLRAVVPGRCFRNESTDASHEHTFYQLEGIMIDKDISIANLVAVMRELLTGVFGHEVKVRLRPGYFPFVEPGFELDMECVICEGKGCSVCKQSGWVEVLPCGLVHPEVIRHGGLDPTEYSGFAFGLGLTRLVMMKYGIEDIRWLQGGDLRFLKQF